MKNKGKLILTVIALALAVIVCACNNGEAGSGAGKAETENTTAYPDDYFEDDINDSVNADELKNYIDEGDIMIIYTNDIHCCINQPIGFDTIKEIRQNVEESGAEAMIVDCGDHITNKEAALEVDDEIMIEALNEAGYKFSAIGNHEFDEGAEHLTELSQKADFKYLCCNFLDKDGELIFEPYEITEVNGKKIAFIGITTPETITKPRGRDFKDDNDEYLYSFCEWPAEDLYAQVQKYITEAKQEGADYVIALSHLGVNEGSWPYTVMDVIQNTEGLDIALDGHSHTIVEERYEKDASGKDVMITQTGAYFKYIGCLIIKPDNEMIIKFIG